MAYRWHPAGADTDPEDPRAWATCDRCGRLYNLCKLQWQWDYRGGPQLENIRLLVCDPCYDAPQPQNAAWILGPDPPPIFNARPEPYTIDTTNFLTTDDGSIITTDGGTPFITSEPNPETNPFDTNLTAELVYPSGSVSSVFLDLFDGNPLTTGVSILPAITGSATRPDVSSSLTTVDGIAQNTSVLGVGTGPASPTNVSFAALYDAATGGTLLTSGPVGANVPITLNNPVQFLALGLTVNLN